MAKINFTRLSCLSLLTLTPFAAAHADCVVGAQLKLQFVVIDSHTILLTNGSGDSSPILIKSFAFFYPSSSVTILKDSFCDFEDAVLYVDGELVDVQQIKRIG